MAREKSRFKDSKKFSISGPVFKAALEHGRDPYRYRKKIGKSQYIEMADVRKLVEKGSYVHCSYQTDCAGSSEKGVWEVSVDDQATDYIVFHSPPHHELSALKDLPSAKGAKRPPSKRAVQALLDAISRHDLAAVQRFAPEAADGDVDGRRPLNVAADYDHADIVKILLPHCDARVLAKGGFTSLMSAWGSIECSKLLIGLVDPLLTNENGDTALMYAASGETRAVVDLLLPLSDPKAVNADGETALMFAAKSGRADCVEALLPVSDANAQDKLGRTALMTLIPRPTHSYGSEQVIGLQSCAEKLIPGTDLNLRDLDGWTALMNVVGFERPLMLSNKVLELLIEGSDARLINDKGDSVLTLAAVNNLPCIRKLLPISDANHQNGEGDTALIIAAKCCRIDAVRLLAPETDVNLRNKEGRNALMECLDALSKSSSYGGASRGSISNYPLAAMRCALRLLPLTNLEAQAQDSNGETALMKAIGNDSLELFEIILPRSDANLRNANGETALMLADFRTERAFFDLLLPLSDANIQDNKGRTALMRARSDKEAIRVLLTRSNVNAQDNEGFTALMHAADQEWEGVVDLLLPHANVTLKNRAGETAQVLARKCGNTNLANRIRDKEVSQNEHAELQDLIKEPAPNPASGKKTKARGTKWGPG